MKLNNNDDSHNSGLNLLIYNMLLDIESHPAWVCGLKLKIRLCVIIINGHTLRGCVDWNTERQKELQNSGVTPCVGVWIETKYMPYRTWIEMVTPCVGVWIETASSIAARAWAIVTPCVGVWIETRTRSKSPRFYDVTPCVGVWIETFLKLMLRTVLLSHPAWVCGLKLGGIIAAGASLGHTLRGCVDWNRTWIEMVYLINVTPCVGVWIETMWYDSDSSESRSHPAWVCGLKLLKKHRFCLILRSHPAWVCGLKLYNRFHECSAFWVTPCVGVWIETIIVIYFWFFQTSHPAWVCGLKP